MADTGRKHPSLGDIPGWLQVIVGVVGVLATLGVIHLANSSSTSHGGPHPGGGSGGVTGGGGTGNPVAKTSLGPQLTSAQLNAILVPQSAYQKLPGASDGIVQADSDSYAIQGGIPSLKLCNAAIQIAGLGADSSSSYASVTVLPGDIYFGSDAASFAGRGAEQLLAAAGSQGPTCGWRSVPGPRLDDQAVRLTTDQAGPEGTTLHDDVMTM